MEPNTNPLKKETVELDDAALEAAAGGRYVDPPDPDAGNLLTNPPEPDRIGLATPPDPDGVLVDY